MSELIVPLDRRSEALELLVSSLSVDARGQQILVIQAQLDTNPEQAAGLLGWFRGAELEAVCWLQTQTGRFAMFWPPRWSSAEDRAITALLIDRALQIAQQNRIVLVQSLLATDAFGDVAALEAARFSHIADVLYLASLRESFPRSPANGKLEFVPLDTAGVSRIADMIERSYEGTRDCPALDGVRSMDDVLDGYRAVGQFRPELWLVARCGNEDVGCALLADHSPELVWELLYMGIAPEARGQGFGLEITRHAQWLAAQSGIERMLLAVDQTNEPALLMYAQAGFEIWDRRSVFARVFGVGLPRRT